MDYQEAIVVLQKLLEKHSLDAEEEEAITVAIGMLSWAVLAKSKLKAQKARREKSTDGNITVGTPRRRKTAYSRSIIPPPNTTSP